MARYTIPIEGIEKQKITLEVGGPFSKPKLFVDGLPAEPGPKANLYKLRMDDNTEVIAWVRQGVFDPSPMVWVEEQEIGVAEPFTFWQWCWLALPLIFFFTFSQGSLGKWLGFSFGLFTMLINGRVLRNNAWEKRVRYGVSAGVFIAAIVCFEILTRVLYAWVSSGG